MNDYTAHPAHIWIGTSVEDRKRAEERIPLLRSTPAAVRWLSAEPLLGPLTMAPGRPVGREWPGARWMEEVDLDLAGIDWVVVGGESGPGHRPMRAEWARGIRDACIAQDVPFFFKQRAGARQPPKGEPVLLDGVEWAMYPGDRHG